MHGLVGGFCLAYISDNVSVVVEGIDRLNERFNCRLENIQKVFQQYSGNIPAYPKRENNAMM